MEPLNDDWIKDYEKKDKIYQKLYKEKVYYIPFLSIYCNKDNEIVKIRNEYFLLNTPNYISSAEIKKEMMKNSREDNILYSLSSICQYKVDIEDVNDLINYINKPDKFHSLEELMTDKQIPNIYLKSAIQVVHDINTLLFLYIEKTCRHQTKKTSTNNNKNKTISKKKK
jgi:hypothetical protein